MKAHVLRQVLDRAHFYGLFQKDGQGELQHAPFALSPYPLPQTLLQTFPLVTQLSSLLIWRVANAHDFLREVLEPVAVSDEFVRFLLGLLPSEVRQQHQLLFNRNDFLIERGANEIRALQVELNTISASFAHLSERTTLLHQQLFREEFIAVHPLTQRAGQAFAVSLRETAAAMGRLDDVVLMLVQPRERNWFDQMGLQAHVEAEGLRVQRVSLEQLHREGALRDGNLMWQGQRVSVVYFRAGYSPDEFATPESRDARQMLEASSAVLLPEAAMQLAGTKKIQQVLTQRSVLQRFLDEESAQTLQESFALMFACDGETPDGEPALERLRREPRGFVVKPQREGGGNNIYGADIPAFLEQLPAKERNAYVAMQRIQAEERESLLVVNQQAQWRAAIHEVGRYGVLRAEGDQVKENAEIGHLVRTKAADVNEGGVVAGFACLNSLATEP